MKLRPGFDDDLQAKKQRWSLPVRSIGHLMVVVAASGLTFAMAAGKVARRRQVRPNPVRISRPISQVRAVVPQPRDPFVVTAPAEIDAKMVVVAPAGIDEAMVFNPYAGERQMPGVGPMMPLPGDGRGQMPDGVIPPQRNAPTKPR